ncbi:neuronal acetylcholine receptor subunit alpha-2-like [Clytia hemisphaerica]|uniref:Uncharacterized protein n=1 Tax=Clytia hemisphaerica TaxID=252671 RepID=A0A7M6DN13_9CNID
MIFLICSIKLVVILMFLRFSTASKVNSEMKLVDYILANYSKQARPVINPRHSINVTFGIEIVHLIKVDDRNQMLTTKIWVRQQWLNELLKWDSSKWSGTTEVQIDGQLVWVPDIVLYNNADSEFSGGVEKYKTRIIQYSDGTSFWLAPATFTSTCSIDIKYFPFDRQECHLKFGSWTFDIAGINLLKDNRPLITDQYSASSEWDLIKAEKLRHVVKYQCCPEPYVDITFNLVLLRKPLYFVFNVIAPCLVLVMTVFFGFFLPPESGERISLTITILLAVAVFLQLISDALPRNSNSVPMLAVFYMAIMAESAFSLITTCIVLVIHYRSSERGAAPMPKWVRSFFLGTCAKFFGIHGYYDELETMQTETRLGEDANKNHSSAYDNGFYMSDEYNDLQKSNPNSTLQTNNFSGTLDVILKEIQIITKGMLSSHQKSELQEDWRLLARVLDRLFFWLFLVTVVSSALGILVPVYLIHHG